MPRVITLTNIKITGMSINPENQSVIIAFREVDDAGKAYSDEQLYTFYRTLPPFTGTQPETWHQLTAKQSQAATLLFQELKEILMNRVAGEVASVTGEPSHPVPPPQGQK